MKILETIKCGQADGTAKYVDLKWADAGDPARTWTQSVIIDADDEQLRAAALDAIRRKYEVIKAAGRPVPLDE